MFSLPVSADESAWRTANAAMSATQAARTGIARAGNGVGLSASSRIPNSEFRIPNSIGLLDMVLGQTLVLTAAGITVGLAGAAALTRYLAGMLFGVTPLDPTTFVGVALTFGAVAICAALVSARRATTV